MFIKSSLNKNTLGIKKCRANRKQLYLCATKNFDISVEANKSPTNYVANYLNDIQLLDWFCHLAIFFVPNIL